MKTFLSRQFVLFLITGGVAAAVNFGSRIAYNQVVDFSTAIVLAYITGMVTAFVLAKVFVFTDSSNSTSKSAVYFTLVNLAAVAQTWAVSMLLYLFVLDWFGVLHFKKEIAHFVGVIVPVFTSYIGHKHLSFKS